MIKDVKITTYKVHTDGGSRGNPGPSAAAFIIVDSSNQVIKKDGEYIGIATNNLAEYTAVSLALKYLTKVADGTCKAVFFIDSLLVVNQLNGLYKIKNRELWPLYEEITSMVKYFRSIEFTHVSRELNGAADAEVNRILDLHTT